MLAELMRHAAVVAALAVLAATAFAAPVLDSSVTILQSPDEALPVRKAIADLQTDFAKVFGATPRIVARERRPYYEFEVLIGIAMNQESNRVLYLVSKAVLDYRAGDKARARAEALEALKPLDKIRDLEARAEYGKWKNWYRGEWLDGIDHTRELVQAFVRYIDDPDMTLPLPALPNDWQGYYHIMHYEGDQTVDVH